MRAISEDGNMILHTNAIKFYPNSLEVLLMNGLDPDTPAMDGNTALSACAGLAKYFNSIQLLVQYGADVNAM